MDLNTQLSQLMGANGNRTGYAESFNIPVHVIEYRFGRTNPADDTVHNSRIIGVRLDTNEHCEVALRDLNNQAVQVKRPSLRRLAEDPRGQALHPGVRPGGVIMVENCYVDRKLTPMDESPRSVLNARWLKGIYPEQGEGYALVADARINTVFERPDNSHSLYVEILSEDINRPTSIDQFESAFFRAMDPTQQDRSTRPGTPVPFVRITSPSGESFMQRYLPEFKGADEGYGPAPVERSRAKYSRDERFQGIKDAIGSALATEGYSVEVIAGSTVSAGHKALEHVAKGDDVIRPTTVAIADDNGQSYTRAGFTRCTIGMRLTRDRNGLVVTRARSLSNTPKISMTGQDHNAIDTTPNIANQTDQTPQPSGSHPSNPPQQSTPHQRASTPTQQAAPRQQAPTPTPQAAPQQSVPVPAKQAEHFAMNHNDEFVWITPPGVNLPEELRFVSSAERYGLKVIHSDDKKHWMLGRENSTQAADLLNKFVDHLNTKTPGVYSTEVVGSYMTSDEYHQHTSKVEQPQEHAPTTEQHATPTQSQADGHFHLKQDDNAVVIRLPGINAKIEVAMMQALNGAVPLTQRTDGDWQCEMTNYAELSQFLNTQIQSIEAALPPEIQGAYINTNLVDEIQASTPRAGANVDYMEGLDFEQIADNFERQPPSLSVR